MSVTEWFFWVSVIAAGCTISWLFQYLVMDRRDRKLFVRRALDDIENATIQRSRNGLGIILAARQLAPWQWEDALRRKVKARDAG